MANITQQDIDDAKKLHDIVTNTNAKNLCYTVTRKKIGEWSHHNEIGFLNDLRKQYLKQK